MKLLKINVNINKWNITSQSGNLKFDKIKNCIQNNIIKRTYKDAVHFIAATVKV